MIHAVKEERLDWETLVNRYPDQWVYVADPEPDLPPRIESGVVLLADVDKKRLYARIRALPLESRCTQVVFTGIPPEESHAWRNVTLLPGPHHTR